MNNQFAETVFPIINFVLEQEAKVVSKFDRNNFATIADVTRIQQEITAKIDKHSRDIAGNEEWEHFAKYAIIAWIDGLMIKNMFTREHWRDLVLEVQYFRMGGTAEDEFFKRCEQAKRKGYKNAVEVFFLCFVLGFRGIYEDPSVPVNLPQLPRNGMQWQKEIAGLVTSNLSKTNIDARPAFRFNNEPSVGRRQFFGALVAFIACAAALAATILVPIILSR